MIKLKARVFIMKKMIGFKKTLLKLADQTKKISEENQDFDTFYINYFIYAFVYHIGGDLYHGDYITQILVKSEEIGKQISNSFDTLEKKKKHN